VNVYESVTLPRNHGLAAAARAAADLVTKVRFSTCRFEAELRYLKRRSNSGVKVQAPFHASIWTSPGRIVPATPSVQGLNDTTCEVDRRSARLTASMNLERPSRVFDATHEIASFFI
jgi:hypothetical protein